VNSNEVRQWKCDLIEPPSLDDSQTHRFSFDSFHWSNGDVYRMVHRPVADCLQNCVGMKSCETAFAAVGLDAIES